MLPKIITDFQTLKLLPNIQTLLLDLDNTCYQYEPCHTTALQATKDAIEQITGPLPHFNELYKEAQQKVKAKIPTQAASHSRILYFQAMFETLGRTDGHQHLPRLEKVYWDTFMSVMKKTAGLDEFLAECRKNGTTVVVVSDLTIAIQCAKINVLDIADKIDYLVTAEEAGADKPNQAPFLIALEKAGGTPHTALVIGDSPEKDIAGAEALGIPSILFRHDTQIDSEAVR